MDHLMNAHGPPATLPLVGRRHELALFDRLLADVENGPCRVLEIVGEPGAGKTRLMAAFGARAETAGVRVATGQAVTDGPARDFGVFADALEEPVAAVQADLAERLGQQVIGLLAPIFPLLGPGTASEPGGTERRNLVHRGVRALLDHLSAAAGLVLVLDEVQRADEASVELLCHLVRRPLNVPLLLVIAHRPRQAPATLLNVLGTAAYGGTVHRLDLGPLDFADAVRLLPAEMCPTQRRALFRDSGGNPGLLTVLATAVTADGAAAPAGYADADPQMFAAVPPSTMASALLDVRALSPLGRLVAHAAAVVGNGFDSELVATVAEITIARTLAGIDELIDNDLIRPDAAQQLRYRHPAIRAVCYHDAGGGWRLGAHGRAEAALRAREAPLLDRAWHIEHAWGHANGSAAEVLVQAARSSGDSSPVAVSRWLRILERLPGRGGLAEPELLAWRARTEALAGHLRESHHLHLSALRHADALPAGERVQLIAWAAQVSRLLGWYDEARGFLEREGPPDEGPLVVALAQVALDGEQDLHGVHTSLAEVADRAEPALAAHATAVHAAALVEQGLTEDAVRLAADAARALDEPRDRDLSPVDLASRGDALCWLGAAELNAGQFQEAARHLSRGLALCERAGHVHLLVQFHVALGTVHLKLGRLDAAAEHAADASGIARATGSGALLASALTFCSHVAHAVGDIAASLHTAQLAVGAAPGGRVHRDALIALRQAGRGSRSPATPPPGRSAPFPPAFGGGSATERALLCQHDGAPDGARIEWRANQAQIAAVLRAATAVAGAGGGSHPALTARDDSAGCRLDALSARELQVAELVSRGRTNQQIARTLTLSHKTVETYLRRIFTKLDVSSRSEVASLIGAATRIA